MIGYWSPRCPVRTDHDGVLATVYRKPRKSLVALAHWPGERTRRKAFVASTAVPPRIDGRLGPAEWENAARLTNLTVFGGEALAKEQTVALITHDATKLYIAFRSRHSHPEVKASAKTRDSATWKDDAIEFFLQPNVNDESYYQFVGNSRGVFADNRDQEMAWNGDWEYRAAFRKGLWEGELSVSFASLGMAAPQEGTRMGFNLCRDQQLPSQRLSCWSPVSGSFHEVNGFGRLVFSSTKAPTREVAGKGMAESVTFVRLAIDWDALGLDPREALLTAPTIQHFQRAARFTPDDEIPVERGKGWLLVVANR